MDLMTWLRSQWDRVVGWVLVGVGVLLIVVASSGVARSRYVLDQLSYLMSGGVAGLGALVLGAALLVAADSHDEWRKLDRVEALLRQRAAADPVPSSGGGLAAHRLRGNGADADRLVSQGMGVDRGRRP